MFGEEIFWALGSSGPENVFITFYEACAFFFVSIIEGEDENISKSVRVAVEWTRKYMWNHRPTSFFFRFCIVGYACSGHSNLFFSPHTIKIMIGEFFSSKNSLMSTSFECYVLNLAKNSSKGITEFFIEKFSILFG